MFRFVALTSNRKILINPLIGVDNAIIQLIDLNDNIKDKLMLKFLYWNDDYTNTNVFQWSCRNGHLEVVKWLVETFDDIDVHAENEEAFILSCVHGYLEIAKWLFETFGDIDVHANNDEAFRYSCSYGHLEIVKWLVKTFDDIDVHIHNEEAFRRSCETGQLEVAKLLITIIPDIRQNNDNYLKIANDSARYNLTEYICDQSPYYKCEYKDGKPIGYTIKEYINIKR